MGNLSFYVIEYSLIPSCVLNQRIRSIVCATRKVFGFTERISLSLSSAAFQWTITTGRWASSQTT